MTAAGRDGCECTSGTLSNGECSSSDESSDDGSTASFLKVAFLALSCLLALLL
jgi:hypothetical protein